MKTIFAVLIILFWPALASAQDRTFTDVDVTQTCKMSRGMFKSEQMAIDEFLAYHFEKQRRTSLSFNFEFNFAYHPLGLVMRFTRGGCYDSAFLKELMRAMNDAMQKTEIPEEDLIRPVDRWATGPEYIERFKRVGAYVEFGLEMYVVLGDPAPLRDAISRLEALKAQGNTNAMIALAELGGAVKYRNMKRYFPNAPMFARIPFQTAKSLQKIFDNKPLMSVLTRTKNPLLAVLERFDRVEGGATLRSWYFRLTDPEMIALQKRLSGAAEQNIKDAAASGDALASVILLTGKADPVHLNLCVPQPKGWQRTKHSASTLSRLDDPQAVVSTLRRWVVEDRYTEYVPYYRLETPIAATTLYLANIASDCGYSNYKKPDVPGNSFNMMSQDLAIEMVKHFARNSHWDEKPYLALTYSRWYGADLSPGLAVALAIDRGSGDAGKYYAAARFLLGNGAYLADKKPKQFFDVWVPRFSRQTIREAQKILAKYRLYKSGIDGIAGPGFRRAVLALDCPDSSKPEACFPETGRMSSFREESWLRPYLVE